MNEIIKQIDERIEYWNSVAAEADEKAYTHIMTVCDTRACEAEKIKEIILSSLKKTPKSKIDDITTEMAEHICDNLCRHPRDTGDDEKLEDICAECKLGQFICDILNESK